MSGLPFGQQETQQKVVGFTPTDTDLCILPEKRQRT